MASWWSWYTQQAQTLPGVNPHVGSNPTDATMNIEDYIEIPLAYYQKYYEPRKGDLVYRPGRNGSPGTVEIEIKEDTDLIQEEFYPLVENFGCIILRPRAQVHMERFKELIEELRYYDAVPIEGLDIYEDGRKVEVDPRFYEEWSFCGMNNRDFLKMEIWKDEDFLKRETIE